MPIKKDEVAKNILIALGVVGVVSIAILMPGLSKAVPLLLKINPSRINQEIKRLQKRGLIEIIKRKSGAVEVKLSKQGRQKLIKIQIDNIKIEKPDDWDGKWRLVIFDVPVTKNYKRELLRKKMKNLGFYKLQGSVFVHPFPCLEVVSFLRNYYEVNSEVEYMEVLSLESQNKLVDYFFTNS